MNRNFDDAYNKVNDANIATATGPQQEAGAGFSPSN
jgi:hypothetical protein